MPTAAWAFDRFSDVPDSNVFHDDIGWMADNGVTLGCNPPTNDQYCPSDNVTREQMAAFMRRLAENQVVDAATAVDSDTLDGRDSSEFDNVFAVVSLNSGTLTVLSQNGLADAVKDGIGDYTLTFDRDVDACAWTATVGARNGATQTSTRTITLNGGGIGDPSVIRVHVEDGVGSEVDATFNIAVTC
jgi:hypothetical protein